MPPEGAQGSTQFPGETRLTSRFTPAREGPRAVGGSAPVQEGADGGRHHERRLVALSDRGSGPVRLEQERCGSIEDLSLIHI